MQYSILRPDMIYTSNFCLWFRKKGVFKSLWSSRCHFKNLKNASRVCEKLRNQFKKLYLKKLFITFYWMSLSWYIFKNFQNTNKTFLFSHFSQNFGNTQIISVIIKHFHGKEFIFIKFLFIINWFLKTELEIRWIFIQ